MFKFPVLHVLADDNSAAKDIPCNWNRFTAGLSLDKKHIVETVP